jgi:hypothetical protein
VVSFSSLLSPIIVESIFSSTYEVLFAIYINFLVRHGKGCSLHISIASCQVFFYSTDHLALANSVIVVIFIFVYVKIISWFCTIATIEILAFLTAVCTLLYYRHLCNSCFFIVLILNMCILTTWLTAEHHCHINIFDHNKLYKQSL